MSKGAKQGFLDLLITEADAYSSMDMIESLLQSGGDLSLVPVQPLYMAIKNLPPEQSSQFLILLSKEQRQTFRDLDLWFKDDLDVENFEYWIPTYFFTNDEKLQTEFVKSDDFQLYMKSKFNIWTFDTEDPEYPEHDNYFLTDDMLLLFEFSDDYPFIQEIRFFIRRLYADLGVEKAYQYIFTTISDGFMTYQEEQYRLKKERLKDSGFVDYYDALEINNCFPKTALMDHFISKKSQTTGEIDSWGQNQILDRTALSTFRDGLDSLEAEWGKIQDPKRAAFLKFNFLRLVNGTLTLGDALKSGRIAVNRVGQKTKNSLNLGFDYLTKHCMKAGMFQLPEGLNLLDMFDFSEIYKIGNSLFTFALSDLKKKLRECEFEDENETFLGQFWNEFLDFAYDEPVKLEQRDLGKVVEVTTYEHIQLLSEEAKMLSSILPFAARLRDVFTTLAGSGQLNDGFYQNYTVDQIDFESILMSSYANFNLGVYEKIQGEKLGLTKNEYVQFTKNILNSKGEFEPTDEILNSIKEFKNGFGLNDVYEFEKYLCYLLKSQMEGYDFENLGEEEFAHVGGPIILVCQ